MSAKSDARGEDGLTLVEITVTLMILSIVSIMLFTFMDGVTNIAARSDRHVRAEQEAQLVLRKMTEEIRAASPVVGAAGCTSFGDCLEFDIPRNTVYEEACVRRTVAYKLDRVARRITRDSKDYVWNTATGSCVATNVVTGRRMIESLNYPSTKPLFELRDADGTVLDSAASAANLAIIERKPTEGGVSAIQVNLIVRYQLRNAPDLVLSSNAVLRNGR